MQPLRTVRLTPYRRGAGPTFTLRMYDGGGTLPGAPQYRVSYTLDIHEHGRTVRLFEGSDFGCSPMHAIDSDDCVRALLSFLTLRPGDTDADYFAGYTNAQRIFVEQHAEALSVEVMTRFGEDC